MIKKNGRRGLVESFPATKKETTDAAKIIHDQLNKEGSSLVADLFLEYQFIAFHQDEEDINSGEEDIEIAFMQPDTGCIFLNLDSPMILWTTFVTHEIMHFFLDHSFRAVRKMAKILGFPTNKLTPQQVADITKAIYSDGFSIANIAGDTEIANIVYDEDQTDKIKKYLVMYGKSIQVIINETYPEYMDMEFEDILEDLYNKYYGNIKIPEFEVIEGKLIDDTTFESDDGIIYDTKQLLGN